MIPLGDENHTRVRFPVVTTALVVVNVLVFLYELWLGEGAGQNRFLVAWGVVPLEYHLHLDLPPTIPAPYYATMLTSMFLHAGWMHLGGNMLYLWIFGDNVEDRFGRGVFLAFYLVTGMAGSLAQILSDPSSPIPEVGASGAISGVLGAYLVLFPRNRVRVLWFFFVSSVPAFVVIGLWAVTQFLAGTAGPEHAGGGGVAYLAHLGGFATGVFFAALLRMIIPPPTPPPSARWTTGDEYFR